MPIVVRPTAHECALLIITMIYRYREEKGKEVSRLRISRSTLRKLCCRQRLEEVFVQEVTKELAEFGWLLFPVGDDYGLVETTTATSWVRLGTTRVSLERKRLTRRDPDIVHLLEQYVGGFLTDDEDD